MATRLVKGGETVRTAVLCSIVAVCTAVCAAGWWVSSLSLKGVIHFIVEKGYTPPTAIELRACIRQVLCKFV